MISIQVNDLPDSRWNQRLIDSGFGTVYQTKEWAELMEYQGYKPRFLHLNKNGKIVGQLLITEISKLKNNRKIGKIFTKLTHSKYTTYKWRNGPVIFDLSLHSDSYIKLEEFFVSQNCRVSGTEHPLLPGPVSKLQKLTITPWSTFLIDLSKPKQELYDKIDKHSGRKNIERAIKREVQIEEITEKSLQDYFTLLIESKQESDSKPSFENLKNVWRLLKPLGYSGFLAKKNDKPIGGLLFSFINNFIIEAGVARSKFDQIQKLYSQDLIKWKIIEWGISKKMKFYDLSGVNPNPTSEKEKGILQYKKKWGGKTFNYSIIKK